MNLLSFKGKVIQRNSPKNLDESDIFFYKRSLYELPSMYIRGIQNVLVTSIGVLYKNFWPLANLDLPLPKKLINKKQFYLKHLLVNLLRKRMIVKTENTFIIFANRNASNYYHWMLESIPRLFVLKEFLQDGILLIPFFCNSSFHKEVLSFFDIAYTEIARPDTFYCFQKIITADYPAISSSHNPELLLKLRQHFYERIEKIEQAVGGEKIFISRKPNSKRKLVNQACVEECLLEYGFSVVYLEDHSFEEQVRFFYHAKFVVGIHGAGLSNLLFMQSGSVLELRASDQEMYGLCFYTLSDAVGLGYYYQLCEPTIPKDYIHTDLVVDVDVLKDNLLLMLDTK